MNGYNFTERVRKVLALAREEAARLGHPYLGSEHELLGILREGEGVAIAILENLYAPPDEVRERLEASVKPGTGSPPGANLPFTSRGKKVLELAMTEAREASHSYVGTEHLLLGILREERGIAAHALTSFGLTLEAARAEMHRILGSAPGIPSRSEFLQVTGSRSSGGLTRLPERIEAVIAEANKVAGRAGATHLEGFHVAIGLLAHHEGIAVAAMERMGCDLPRLAAELEAAVPTPGAVPVSSAPTAIMPLAPELQTVLAAAIEEQQASHDPVIGTQHVLLALLERCPEVARAFNAHGVTAERLRSEARRIAG